MSRTQLPRVPKIEGLLPVNKHAEVQVSLGNPGIKQLYLSLKLYKKKNNLWSINTDIEWDSFGMVLASEVLF